MRNNNKELQQRLREKADPKTRDWWEGYVKGSAPFLGVKMAHIRALMHQWYRESVSEILSQEEQVDLALSLFEGDYSEEKLAGILFLQEILLPEGWIKCENDLDRLGELFTRGYIYDWNICDWFCIKALGELIKYEGMACAQRLSAWKSAENLWQARASLVAFVPVADNPDYYPLIQANCKMVIKRQERFAKTAVGWILREISRQDHAFVTAVLSDNIRLFSLESLKNATKYFPQEEKDNFVRMFKGSKTNS